MCVVRDVAKKGAPGCRRLARRLHLRVISKRVTPKRGLPSRGALSTRCRIDHRAIHGTLTVLRGRKCVCTRRKHNAFYSRVVQRTRPSGGVTIMAACLSSCVFPHIVRKVSSILANTKCDVILGGAGGSQAQRTRYLRRVLDGSVSKIVVRPDGDRVFYQRVGLCRRLRGSRVPCIFVRKYFPRVGSGPRILLSSFRKKCVVAGCLASRKRGGVIKMFGTSSVRKRGHRGKCIHTLRRTKVLCSPSGII